jgi:hypothetical protein
MMRTSGSIVSKPLAEATHADRREILLKVLAEEAQRLPERAQG